MNHVIASIVARKYQLELGRPLWRVRGEELVYKVFCMSKRSNQKNHFGNLLKSQAGLPMNGLCENAS